MEKQKVMERENNKWGVSSSSNGGEDNDLVRDMEEVIETVGSYTGYRRTQRKECLNLARRLKLLVPLLEEIKESVKLVSSEDLNCLVNLKEALHGAMKLLKKCSCGSKICLALEFDAVMGRFHAVYDKLNQAMDAIPYDEFGISVEVKEQVELMHMQLKRAKRRTDTQDIELAMDIMVVFSRKDDRTVDSAILERLANKLELLTIPDLKAETVAVRQLSIEKDVQNAESIWQIANLLGKLKQIAGVHEAIEFDGPISSKSLHRSRSLLIPHEFLCPITLEIMVDPVTVATGQDLPKDWTNFGSLFFSTNFAIRNLILQWCEENNFELPKNDACVGCAGSNAELIEQITCLVQNLFCTELDVKREAIAKIRMLSKENPDNRILIGNIGAIPPLIHLLSYQDSAVQEQTVTALLNLSIDEENKRIIAREGAIPAIIEILRNGTEEARENSAAALFSLSMLDENKVLGGL
ncbi:hypothetical protein GH714_036674 [Hevea brasiliensis]|uniref:RING-type E3 ubiquitin transferase n=1 Tax=Hevea brasiliensis TaxID=3981 RepID=A0A6A6LQJ3_HEVBR|nr:hypothetical protein GH714_036674 [Hevea brasiliensis]